MPALRGCLDYFGHDVGPGDIFANNDPYAGGSHLNDIFMFKPVYGEGERVCFVGLILHHTDLGGRVAGGQAADSNEIYEEGLAAAEPLHPPGPLLTHWYIDIFFHPLGVPVALEFALRQHSGSG